MELIGGSKEDDIMSCIYLIKVDITPWHGDVFGHPDYEYFCAQKEKERKIFSWTCTKCPYYTEEDKNV